MSTYDKLYWLPIVLHDYRTIQNLVAVVPVTVFDVQSMLAITWWVSSITALACGFSMIVITAWSPYESRISLNYMPTNSVPLSGEHFIGQGKPLMIKCNGNCFSLSLLGLGVITNHDVSGTINVSANRVIGVSVSVLYRFHGPIRTTNSWFHGCRSWSIVGRFP